MSAARFVREFMVADRAVVRGLLLPSDAADALGRLWTEGAPAAEAFVADLQRRAPGRSADLAALAAEVDARLGAARDPASAADPSAPPGPPGALHTLAEGRYTDFEVVGQGGMGVVYVALDNEINRRVALKIVRPGAASGERTPPPPTPLSVRQPPADTPTSRAFEELKARFLQEAWVTGGLEHPGIVPVYELGLTRTGIPYYTMRFVRGRRTLADAIDALREGRMEERLRLLEPFLRLCDTVAYAHSRGVLHRDLKPENVALGEFGEVVLLDWGLAKLEGTPEPADSRWQSQVRDLRAARDVWTARAALGTPGYMAPEAAQGQVELVDARSDVYSLGAILHMILLGRLPHEFRDVADYFQRVATERPRPPAEVRPEVPGALSELCVRCLDADPTRRPRSVRELAGAVRDWMTQSALRQEAAGLRRDARSALEAANDAEGAARLAPLDRAAAALRRAADLDPGDPGAEALEASVARLRARALDERERKGRRRLLARVAVAALVAAAVVAVAYAADVDQRRQHVEQQRARADREAALKSRALDEVLRLADAKRLADLLATGERLRLSTPDAGQVASAWETLRAELVRRGPEHRTALEALRARAQAPSPPWRFASPELAWQHEVLSEIVDRLATVEPDAATLPARVRRIASVAERVHGAATHPGWPAAQRSVAADPRFRGLSLAPQVGLVPLGPDPDSRLEEFAYVGSGSVPARRADTGRLEPAADAAIVLVLLPGGTYRRGAQRSEASGANFDPSAWPDEAPVHEVTLAPFFLAKEECTQAQWATLTGGENPSRFRDLVDHERLPVEHVSWQDGTQWLGEHGLSLPTEAQWEFACRGGTQTPWWTGTDLEAARQAAWTQETAEGRPHAVGRGKRPNAFGLHDVLGNVWEWCADAFAAYVEAPLADPRVEGDERASRVLRGGAWDIPMATVRIADRYSRPPGLRAAAVGLRPARRLEPAGPAR